MQDGRLPLHHAAVKGAPFDVMKLLLDANHEAVTAADKVRRCEPMPPPALPAARGVSPPLGSILFTAATPSTEAASATALRRMEDYRCITP